MTLADVRALGQIPVLALTLDGESRGEPVEGRIAVGCTIRNRVRHPGWWGEGYVGVCLAPEQFSCWNVSDPNALRLIGLAVQLHRGVPIDDPVLAECFWIAEGIVGGRVLDRVGNSTHYYAQSLKKPPAWTVGASLVARIGSQLFFGNVK